jgi:hypothetical protein
LIFCQNNRFGKYFLKPRRTSSIRSNLAWLVAACLVPAILAAVGFLAYAYQQQRAQLISDTVASARELVSDIDREFDRAQLILGTLASSPYLKSQDFKSFHAQATELLRLGFINNIALIDSSGQQLLNTAKPFGEPLPKTGVMAQVQHIFKTGLPEIPDISVGLYSSGRWSARRCLCASTKP